MIRLLLTTAALLWAGSALAAAPVAIISARVFAPPPATHTVAIVRPETGSKEADAALTEGLRDAGFTVVPRSAGPVSLVSYVTDVSSRGPGAASSFNTAGLGHLGGSVTGVITRSTAVVAWAAGSDRPAAENILWVTRLRSSGLSREPTQFLPAMLRAGAAGYGRDLPHG